MSFQSKIQIPVRTYERNADDVESDDKIDPFKSHEIKKMQAKLVENPEADSSKKIKIPMKSYPEKKIIDERFDSIENMISLIPPYSSVDHMDKYASQNIVRRKLEMNEFSPEDFTWDPNAFDNKVPQIHSDFKTFQNRLNCIRNSINNRVSRVISEARAELDQLDFIEKMYLNSLNSSTFGEQIIFTQEQSELDDPNKTKSQRKKERKQKRKEELKQRTELNEKKLLEEQKKQKELNEQELLEEQKKQKELNEQKLLEEQKELKKQQAQKLLKEQQEKKELKAQRILKEQKEQKERKEEKKLKKAQRLLKEQKEHKERKEQKEIKSQKLLKEQEERKDLKSAKEKVLKELKELKGDNEEEEKEQNEINKGILEHIQIEKAAELAQEIKNNTIQKIGNIQLFTPIPLLKYLYTTENMSLKSIDSINCANLPKITEGMRFLFHNKNLLMIGGPTVIFYNCQSQTCRFLPQLKIEKYHSALAFIHKSIAVIGGITEDLQESSTVEIFNEETWETISPLNIKRSHCQAIKHGQSTYVFGGLNEIIEKTIEKFHTDTWTLIALQIPIEIIRFGIISYKNRILLLGGVKKNSKKSKKIFIFDMKNESIYFSHKLPEKFSTDYVTSACINQKKIFLLDAEKEKILVCQMDS